MAKKRQSTKSSSKKSNKKSERLVDKAIEREYKRLRKNLINRNYRARKAGKKVKPLPKKPKVITQESINKLNRIMGNKLTPITKTDTFRKMALLERLKTLRDDIATGFFSPQLKSNIMDYFDDQLRNVSDWEQLQHNYEEKGQRISRIFAIYKNGEGDAGSGQNLFNALTELFENTTYWLPMDIDFDIETGEIL